VRGTGTSLRLSPPILVGHGYDIHRLAPISLASQPLVVAGVTVGSDETVDFLDVDGIRGEKGKVIHTVVGCVAHSDGDVVYHSIVDGVFGALNLPDIGQTFKDSDPR